MTCRVENGDVFIQTYNAENRLSSVTKLVDGNCTTPGNYAGIWNFAYDGDGTRVGQLYTPYDQSGNPQTPVLTAYFMGGAYEVTDGAVKKYYSLAGMTVAMQDGSGLKYLLTDHLGSVVAVTDASGTLTSQQRYLPFGQLRTDLSGPRITQTDFGYTGQRALDMGLMDYHARFYHPYLNQWTQPDDIIPDEYNPQSPNRYSYALNRPINLNDPTGHDPWWCETSTCEAQAPGPGGHTATVGLSLATTYVNRSGSYYLNTYTAAGIATQNPNQARPDTSTST